MKSGARILGIAASDADQHSVLAGTVVRVDRVVDGVAIADCTVGGRDATAAVQSVIDRIDRPDVAAVLIAGIAPAWFNLIDMTAIDAPGPVVAVSFEASPGLDAAIDREFEGEAREWRRETYRRQPDRASLEVNDERLFVRSADVPTDRAREIVRSATPEGGRPEPLRVARLVARGVAGRKIPDGRPRSRRMDESVSDCRRCGDLVESRSQIVNGVGPGDADLAFVGEAPGENEDREGEPFVGRSGSILDEALADAGVERRDVRITNAVRCRPPDNRDPSAAELDACRDHLETELAAVDPSVVVALGKVPAEFLLDRSVAVTSEAGSIETVALGEAPRDVVISVHPAATLYDRSQREVFDETIASAVERADVESNQASIADF